MLPEIIMLTWKGVVGSYIRIKIKHWRVPTYPAKKPSLPGSDCQYFPPFYNEGNQPWGDIWVVTTLAKISWIVSKNTGTINPQILDIQAITNELVHIGASVFVTQETNVHWDLATNYQIYQQYKQIALQFKLTTVSSQEPAANIGTNLGEFSYSPLILGQATLCSRAMIHLLDTRYTKSLWAKTINEWLCCLATECATRNLMQHPIWPCPTNPPSPS